MKEERLYDPATSREVRVVLVTIIGLATFLLGAFGGVWASHRVQGLTELCEDPSPPSYLEGHPPPTS